MERRRESRLFIKAPGTYRQAGGEPRAMHFSQISGNGCRIVENGCVLSEGDRIELALGPVDELMATVRWRGPDMAGIEFDEALDPLIVEFFAAHCGTSD